MSDRTPKPTSTPALATAIALLAAFAVAAAATPVHAQYLSTGQPRPPGGYAGYGGTRWSTDYGIASGRCDRDQIVVGATDSGQTLVQRHEENLKNRSVGITGATSGTGVLLSTGLAGRFDERDRRCLGHVLELGTVGRQVGWTNGTTRQSYLATVGEYTPSGSVPTGTGPSARERCRVLVLTAGAVGIPARGPPQTLVACQANPGVWLIR